MKDEWSMQWCWKHVQPSRMCFLNWIYPNWKALIKDALTEVLVVRAQLWTVVGISKNIWETILSRWHMRFSWEGNKTHEYLDAHKKESLRDVPVLRYFRVLYSTIQQDRSKRHQWGQRPVGQAYFWFFLPKKLMGAWLVSHAFFLCCLWL